VTFVDETKGISCNPDYESYSEYATPPPETRSSDAISTFSTPATDIFAESQHPSIFTGSRVTAHGLLGHRESPTAVQSLTSPLPHKHWEQPLEQRTVSNPPGHDSLPFPSSPNPLTIEGILNKGGIEPVHPIAPQAYELSTESPPIPPIYSDKPAWPLADPAEAKLLRHFIQNLAIWVSNEEHFQFLDQISDLDDLYMLMNDVA
jgi:hypothetical protein